MERRLAAILAADVVGYSRLMELDEAGTFARLRQMRIELVEPAIARHRGRIFKLMGDGLLAEFGSAVDAVECAAAIQKAISGVNRDLPSDHRIHMRIGVHVGDVIVEGEDRHGEAVNIAARLQQFAEPGGVCASRAAIDHVKGKLALGFELRGEERLKNIADPVCVFRVRPEGAASKPLPPLHEKPSIAVLPFANMSGDPEQQYFSDGITEDIITELSRFRSLIVIAPPSSFAYRNRSISIQAVGRDLGVHYVVEGSVRRAGDRIRVTVQLIDAQTGSHLWAERYDRGLADIFSVQDEVTQTIVANLAGRLEDAGGERALRKGSEYLSKYDLLLQGKYFLNRGSREDVLHARELFQRVLDVDRDDASAYVGLARSFMQETTSHWTNSPAEAAACAFDYALKAVELDDRESQAHLLLAWAYFRAKANFDLAASQVDRAITLNPNDFNNYCFKGWLLICSGDPDGGIVCANEALRRNPLAPDDCLYTIGVADYLEGKYEQALAIFGKMNSSRFLEVPACMAACYAELDRHADARAQAIEFLKRARSELAESPLQDMQSWRDYWARRMSFKDPAQLERLLAGLSKAGLPE